MPINHSVQSKHRLGSQPHQFGPVEKLIFLSQAAKLAEMSRAELAVLIVLADMANSITGIAWPSFATLAARGGLTGRHAKTAIKKLIVRGFIEVTEQGNRVRSNRYKINLRAGRSDLGNTTQPSDLQSTMVVNSNVRASELECQVVVISSSPESIHPSEYKASEGWDRSQADGGAPNASPLGASLARQPDSRKDQFPEFWEAIGHRATVAESEQAIRELLSQGTEYDEIVAGGRRWAAYNKATGGRRRASPVQWLQKEKWRDDWTVPQSRRDGVGIEEKSIKARAKKPNQSVKGKKIKKKRNPEWTKWRAAYDLVSKPWELAKDKLDSHTERCRVCKDLIVKEKRYCEAAQPLSLIHI